MTVRSLFSCTAFAGTAAVLAATLPSLTACNKSQPPKQPSVPVVVTNATSGDVPYTLSMNGVVEPLQSVAVASQVGGVLDRVAFNEGQDVRAGQLLFQIDPRPFQAALDQARATLARDEAQARSAQRDAERYAALVQKDYVTRSQADQATANAAAQNATVEADRAAVERAQLDLANATIRTPISGRTGSLIVKRGNLVRANSTPPLVVINQIHPILVRFSVPQSRLPELQRYSQGTTIPVTVTPSEGNGSSVHGTLSFIDNTVDSASGTVLLKARFANSAGTLWPGQFVTVQLQLYVQHDALLVPASAVLSGQAGSYVFTVDAAGKAQQRPVVVGRTVDTMAVIQTGLTPGDRVVVDGQSRLTPGAQVIIKGGGGRSPPAPGRRAT